MTVRSLVRRAAGPLSVLAGVIFVLLSVPLEWLGPRPEDSYVFNPPTFSPLWVERTLYPPLTVSVCLLAALGFAGLLFRDGDSMPRWRRWSLSAAVFGGVFAAVALALIGPGGTTGAEDVLAVLGGLLFGLVAFLLGFVGLVAAGAGYLRADRRRLGAALLGGPLGTVVAVAVTWYVDAAAVGLLVGLPIAAMLVVVGYDLQVGSAAGSVAE